MSIKKSMLKIFHHALGKRTPEEKKEEMLEFIKELIRVKKRTPKNKEEKVDFLRQDHFLDSVCVMDNEGKVILSAGDEKEIEKAREAFKSVQGKFPNTRMLVMKEDEGYNILYKRDGLLYIFKSPGEISSIETRIIAEKLEALR